MLTDPLLIKSIVLYCACAGTLEANHLAGDILFTEAAVGLEGGKYLFFSFIILRALSLYFSGGLVF